MVNLGDVVAAESKPRQHNTACRMKNPMTFISVVFSYFPAGLECRVEPKACDLIYLTGSPANPDGARVVAVEYRIT